MSDTEILTQRVVNITGIIEQELEKDKWGELGPGPLLMIRDAKLCCLCVISKKSKASDPSQSL